MGQDLSNHDQGGVSFEFKSLQEIFAAHPVDETTGRDLWRREANRQRLIANNLEKAAPYIARHPQPPDEILATAQHLEGVRKALLSLLRHFENDACVKKILIRTVMDDYEYRDSQELARACELTVPQVKAAKDRLRYSLRKLGAGTFEELVLTMSGRREPYDR